MEQEFKLRDKTYKLKLESRGDICEIDLDGKKHKVNVAVVSSNTISFLKDEQAFIAHFAQKDDKTFVSINGEEFCVEKPDYQAKKSFAGEHTQIGDQTSVSTPMPGKVVKIGVKVGDEVRKNQTLVIVEAMKMENEIKSPVPAKIKKINFKEGDLVDTGQPIVELEPKE